MWAQPLPLRLFSESHALIMEPLIFAVVVIAANHFAVADLLAKAVQVLVVAIFFVATIARAVLLTSMKG